MINTNLLNPLNAKMIHLLLEVSLLTQYNDDKLICQCSLDFYNYFKLETITLKNYFNNFFVLMFFVKNSLRVLNVN